MTLAARVIACLDVDAGRVVKGVNFVDLVDAGDPIELAAAYGKAGIDELVFLDITASSSDRETTLELVRRSADQVFIPVTVGGGIRSVEDIDALLRAGADKVSINTAAISRPELLREAAQRFGSQCIVLSLDARREEGQPSGFGVTTHGGRKSSGLDAVQWAKQAADFGEAIEAGAQAVLAASIFHFGEITVAEVKNAMAMREIPVRTSTKLVS